MIAAWKAEWQKYNPWILICLVSGSSAGIVALKTLGFLLRQPNLEAHSRYHWAAFFQAGHMEWSQMLAPLTLATWAAYVCWIETEANTWKLLLIQPRGRQATFFAKFSLLSLALVTFFAIHLFALIFAGMMLFPDQSMPLWELLLFHSLGPIFCAPILAVQWALALRFHHPIASLAICMIGNIIAIFNTGSWTQWLPWHYTKYLGPATLQEQGTPLAIAVILSLGLIWLAYADFMRKDLP